MDHKSKDSEHGGTSVVQFDTSLEELGFFVELVPSEVNVSVSEVTDELVSGSLDVLHDGEFQDSDESDDLGQSASGDGVRAGDGGPSVGEGFEGVSGLVNVSGEVDSGAGDNLSEEGKHGDASVLDLDVSETVELFLVTALDESERIVETERRLGSEGVLEGAQGGGGSLLLGGSKGGGGGDKGGKDGGLHFDRVYIEYCDHKVDGSTRTPGNQLLVRESGSRRFRVTADGEESTIVILMYGKDLLQPLFPQKDSHLSSRFVMDCTRTTRVQRYLQ